MEALLRDEYGVSPRWVERASRDTRENARFSAVHLQAAGARRILLVTRDAHEPRTRASSRPPAWK